MAIVLKPKIITPEAENPKLPSVETGTEFLKKKPKHTRKRLISNVRRLIKENKEDVDN